MKELFNGEYKAYIRKRKFNNPEIEYIELLFYTMKYRSN